MKIHDGSQDHISYVSGSKVKLSSGTAEDEGKLPVRADEYKRSSSEYQLVKGADASTYKKVFGAIGAALGAFSSHLAFPGGFGVAGAVIGGVLGAAIGGPVGAVIGKAAGGAAGVYAGGKLHIKNLTGKKLGGRIGGAVGHVMGLAAKALRIPLRSDHIEMTKDYSYDKMKTHLDTISYTSSPKISRDEAENFMEKLKPGDIVLTNDEACTQFSIIIYAVDRKGDFNHALLYSGDGKTIESRTVTSGVAEGDLIDVLTKKHHAIAIRPHYEPADEQASAVVEAARDKIGTKYDFLFGMGDNAMYCSEVVYKAVKEGAPQVDFKKRPLITREVILPGDLLRTKEADVIAKVGKPNTLFQAYLAKFV